jgi:hypothetical protein
MMPRSLIIPIKKIIQITVQTKSLPAKKNRPAEGREKNSYHPEKGKSVKGFKSN